MTRDENAQAEASTGAAAERARFAIDEKSLLVGIDAAEVTLGEAEREVAARGFTLGVAIGAHEDTTIAEWLAQGAPGAPSLFADPADHLLAGLEGRLGGKKLEVRPTPRRAVGPDLTALLVGTGGRLGTIERVWLRVHRRDARRPALPLPAGVDLDPAVTPEEQRLVDAITRELLSL